MAKIRKNDQVIITVGKDKGKTGKVLCVLPKKKRVIVEHINTVKKAQRRTQENQQGGFVDIEVPIHVSNVMLVDKKTNKPTRVGFKINKDGSKTRISRRTGEEI